MVVDDATDDTDDTASSPVTNTTTAMTSRLSATMTATAGAEGGGHANRAVTKSDDAITAATRPHAHYRHYQPRPAHLDPRAHLPAPVPAALPQSPPPGLASAPLVLQPLPTGLRLLLRLVRLVAVLARRLAISSATTCHKPFNDASSLRKHAKIHGERQFECSDCGKKFIDNSKLKRHMLVHTGERKYKCTHPGCGKRFALDFNLRSHWRVHTGEKPFACTHPGCGRRFAQVSNLKAHCKTHTAGGGGNVSGGGGGGKRRGGGEGGSVGGGSGDEGEEGVGQVESGGVEPSHAVAISPGTVAVQQSAHQQPTALALPPHTAPYGPPPPYHYPPVGYPPVTYHQVPAPYGYAAPYPQHTPPPHYAYDPAAAVQHGAYHQPPQ